MPDPAPNISTPNSPAGFQPGRVAADPAPSTGLTDADFGDGAPGRTASTEFKAELPADLKLPDGIEIKYDDRDPVHGQVLLEARALAREAGLDQTTFSKMLGLHAKLQLRQNDVELARANIEKQSITNFDTRSAAVISFLDRHLSAEQSRAIQAGVHNRAAFEALETLISRVTGRSPASSSAPSSNGKSWADRMWPNGFDPNPQRAR
jgi:hypothetical protein